MSIPELRRSLIENKAHRLYVRWLRAWIKKEINQQRLKLLVFAWSYWRLLLLRRLSIGRKLWLLWRFLRVDWFVLHGHRPSEIVCVCRAIAEREAESGEAIVEAGCWQGGSTAKLSLIAGILGYRLHVYDSFEGVESCPPTIGINEHDYSGEYASPESVLRRNLTVYGAPDVCEIHKGWFSDTIAGKPSHNPVRTVFIDCDLAKGTLEVLSGVVPSLSEGGVVFSQDYHIRSVRSVIHDPKTWLNLGVDPPSIIYHCGNLASMRFVQEQA